MSLKSKKGQGIIFSSYLIGFSIIRYFVDFLRGDLKKTSYNLYPTQIIAIFIFLFTGIYITFKLFKKGDE